MIGIYLFPINGSQIATVEFDRTGSTKVGQYLINHFFFVPTVIAAGVSVISGIVIATSFIWHNLRDTDRVIQSMEE